ncbi:5-deoxy-glucuronate isomerase [Terrabacter sp. Soil811]|uniref:5-deoxy-glucuronate isomerase n=1 Tax=Terrabacter sp. Soil811 TaxID=1736419 RepID=UPI0006F4437A|nr:5-deoxy-glucuronate isomerase [Terrabacter sp. Soil811]KRF45807.1 5-deoxy-glucuronate isomerase [Terrabacter sp. Soil811]
MSDNERWVRPLGSAGTTEWSVAIDDALDGWSHTRLYSAALAAGESRTVAAGEWEHVVVPLSGSVAVTAVDPEGLEHEAVLAGRASVFAGPTDVAYATRDCDVTVTAEGGPATIAVCGARATRRHTPPFRHVGVADVPVELRGAGVASREVRNFGIPGVLDADSIIACEVITPGGNWSSYPPHKHDEERPGVETELEEIYYFEVAPSAGAPEAAGTSPVGYQRVYGTDDRPIDVLAEVRSGDVVLVPHGWHGPAMAAPGYDLYYLNVMAGPGAERAWLICDDPAHGWVRDTWSDQPVDPRLPLGGAR